MTIRNQVVVVACVVFTLLAFAQYAVQRRMLLPHFAEIEHSQAFATMDRVSDALARENEMMVVSARDWGNWIETYRFVHEPFDAYIHDNLKIDSLRAIHATMIAFVALDGRIVWSLAYDPRSHEPQSLALFAAGRLADDDPLRASLGALHSASGLVSTDRGTMLVATAPILTGTGQGLPGGMLILGRLLSPVELAQAANVRPSALRALPPEATATLRLNPRAARPSASADDRLLETDDTTFVFRELHDLRGRTIATLRLVVEREVTISATHTILVVSGLLFVLAALALAALVAFLNRSVLAPLAEITEHAVHVGQSDDLHKRLDHRGSDELATLARAFDQMVERLARTRSDLIEKSFVAGIAEMASGALHNLGNAMTPLAVRMNTLEALLRQAPVQDMERVAAELGRPGTDPARRADLEQFAVLAGHELAQSVAAARRDAEAAVRQLQGIQRILTDQVRQSRAGVVLESTRLPVLLAQSTELVSPAHRERIEVVVAPEVESLAALRLPATVLRQVFQNLIVNAAEAVKDYPARRGRLCVGAEVIADGDRDLLVCRFADDGNGIAPEVLGRLFQRQFSTKSTSTNSGIGLHWCANALRAIGGEIRVTSAGAGAGACFHVVVPLKADRSIDAARAA